MKRKSKRKSKSSRLKIACEVAQQYARLKETNANGIGTCKFCGCQVHYSGSHGGHFQPKGRNYNRACLDERNIHLSCPKCNVYRGGNPAGGAEYMLSEYGSEVIAELAQKSYQTWSDLEDKEFIETFIKETRIKNRELAKKKSFEVSIV